MAKADVVLSRLFAARASIVLAFRVLFDRYRQSWGLFGQAAPVHEWVVLFLHLVEEVDVEKPAVVLAVLRIVNFQIEAELPFVCFERLQVN